MRNKSSVRSGPSLNSSPSVTQENSKYSQDEGSSSLQSSSCCASSPIPSFSSKRAADMFAAYSNASLEYSVSDSVGMMSQNSTSSVSSSLSEITDGVKRLAKELDQFITRGVEHSRKIDADSPPMSDDAIADLQLATARKLRELLPINRDLLHVAQERNWIPLLLSWLNLHDRPAVQVEALLALTNIAELCAQQSYYQHTQAQTSAVAAAAQAAAAAAVKGSSPSASPFYPFGNATGTNAPAPATYPYPSLVAPAPGSVPFPPLSFSQTDRKSVV